MFFLSSENGIVGGDMFLVPTVGNRTAKNLRMGNFGADYSLL